MQRSGASNARIELHSIQAIESERCEAVLGDKSWQRFAVHNIRNLSQRDLMRCGAMR